MTTYYNINPRFYVSVDCIIFGFDKGSLKLLLLKRNFEPAKGSWSLMGGFVQDGESVNDAAKRVLAELTGLENVYMEQVGTFGEVDRDPGERVISVAYYALININEYDRNLVQQHNGALGGNQRNSTTSFRPFPNGKSSQNYVAKESLFRTYRFQPFAKYVHSVPIAKFVRSYLWGAF